ncbi:YaaR family protein [Brevibacillus sp. B_LB10_24]|jgi:hypothetical protein|uniref:YaaR family protein n=1 Tax=Brevibacillus TaxID=55080 RepID=UPI0003659AFD|nr:YaaR family protein [Brevibacillus massiliensis]
MKIGEGLRAPLGVTKGADARKNLQTDRARFGDILKNEGQRLSDERLTTLLNEIDKQGQILARSRSVHDFYAYKNMVKRFMEEAVRFGVALSDRRSTNRRGRSRLYKILKEVDSRLTQLADDLLAEQAPMIDLLARIGEIRGMLINLYF